MKKLASLVLALVMALALAVPAAAAGEVHIPGAGVFGGEPGTTGFFPQENIIVDGVVMFHYKLKYIFPEGLDVSGGGILSWVGETYALTNFTISELKKEDGVWFHDVFFNYEPICEPNGIVIFELTTLNSEGEKSNTLDQGIHISFSGLGHISRVPVVTKEPTRTEKGEWTVYCGRCGEILDSGEVDKLEIESVSTNVNSVVKIAETAKNSKKWALTFNVTLTLENGESEVVEYTVLLDGNNANLDGKYVFGPGHDLAGYTLTYDIKGNGSNVKAFSLN